MTDQTPEILARLDRIDARQDAILAALAALRAVAIPETPQDPLLAALLAAFGASAFTSAEVLAKSDQIARAAERQGRDPDGLPAALAAERIRNAHGFGRWAIRHLHAVSREPGGTLWALFSKTCESTPKIPGSPSQR